MKLSQRFAYATVLCSAAFGASASETPTPDNVTTYPTSTDHPVAAIADSPLTPISEAMNRVAGALRMRQATQATRLGKMLAASEGSYSLKPSPTFPRAINLLGGSSLGLQDTAQQQPQNGRALPSPLQSPPFPDSDWLGYPLIGAPYSTGAADDPLQKALGLDKWTKSNTYIYGWINPSYNYSTSHDSNQPLSYDLVPNHVELDQVVLMAEKQPDTVQTSHPDWGFRSVNLYGTNYRYTIMDGILSNQLLKYNNLYGFDPVELYGMYYDPKVAQGMVIRFGRYISPPDIEAQLTPDNYMYSHSLMFTVDPYTFMGAAAMIRFSKQWEVLFQVHGGNDMALWSPAMSLNFGILARYASLDGNDGLWFGINSLGAGKVKDYHDDLQQIIATWGHRFNPKYHMMTEAYYMWERDAPLGGTQIFGPSLPAASGGGPGPIIPGLSTAFGIVNYFQDYLGKWDYLSLRTDFLNDPRGYRTGFQNLYFSETLGWCHFFTPMTMFRPEIRWERAFHNPAYDNGTRKTQFEIAMDLVQRF